MNFDTNGFRNSWRDFGEATKRHGTIIEQLDKINEIIEEPITTTKFIRVPCDLRKFVFEVKKLVRAKYKTYPAIELERFYILHFIRCLGNEPTTLKRTKKEKVALEKFARKVMEESIIRCFVREKKEILARVKWRSLLDG